MARDKWIPHAADDYYQAFVKLLPVGPAWSLDPGSTQQKLWRGLCDYWGTVDQNAALLLVQESDPRSTVILLPDWERAWGLPDPCTTEPLTVYDRQVALVAKMTMQGGQSRQFFIDLAEALGYTITIHEFAPYMTGVSYCGDNTAEDIPTGGDGTVPRWELGPPESRFIWTVSVSGVRYTPFMCGYGECGIDHLLEISLATDLECVFKRYKPAHTEVVFDYSGIE